MTQRAGRYLLLLLLSVAGSRAAWGNPATCTGGLPTFLDGVSSASCPGSSNSSCPSGCAGTKPSELQNCQPPAVGNPVLSVTQQADGTYTVRWTFDIVAPWNLWASTNNPSGTLQVFWYNAATAPPGSCDGSVTACPQYGATDEATTYYQQTNLTCAGAPYQFGPFALRAQTCQGPCGCTPFCFQLCTGQGVTPDYTDRNNLVFTVTKAMLGCPEPPKSSCCENLECKECKSVGPGGTSVGGDGPCFVAPDGGPGAFLRYRAGGAGGAGWPGGRGMESRPASTPGNAKPAASIALTRESTKSPRRSSYQQIRSKTWLCYL